MGTNYYAIPKVTDKLKTKLKQLIDDECFEQLEYELPYELHIGKSSAGWCFSLHVIPEKGLNNLDDWVEFLTKCNIRDEYGKKIKIRDLLNTITKRSHPQGLLRHELNKYHCVGHGEGTYDYIIGDFS